MTKREKAFALSLIATITLPMFLWVLFIGFIGPSATFCLIFLITPIMIAGLALMRKPEISKIEGIIGGTIILIMGIIIGMLAFLPEVKMRSLLLIPATIAMAGGYLGIQEAREGEVKKRQYSKTFTFRVSLMGFISALVPVFIVFLWFIIIIVKEVRDPGIFLAGALIIGFPLFSVISIILNTISTVVIGRRETIPEKRTKILIIVTWCMIAFLLTSSFLLFFYY